MWDQATLQRFLSVKALAERGMPGEKDNALRIMKKMEQDFPGIAAQAARSQQQPPKSAPPPNPYAQHTRQGNGNWENIFGQFAGMAGAAYDFAQKAANAYMGVELAKSVEHYTRVVKSENVLIGLKMPQHIYWQAKGLNALQIQAFRKEVHNLLDKELNKMFGIQEP